MQFINTEAQMKSSSKYRSAICKFITDSVSVYPNFCASILPTWNLPYSRENPLEGIGYGVFCQTFQAVRRNLKTDLNLPSSLLEIDSLWYYPSNCRKRCIKKGVWTNCRILIFGEVEIKNTKMWESRFQVQTRRQLIQICF